MPRRLIEVRALLANPSDPVECPRRANALVTAFCGWPLAVGLLASFVVICTLAVAPEDDDRPTERAARELLGSTVGSLSFSPKGTHLVAITVEGKILLEDLSTRQMVTLDETSAGFAPSAAFSTDGCTLIVAGEDPRVSLWDVATFTSRPGPQLGSKPIRALAISPDGTLLVTASRSDGEVRIHDWPSGTLRADLPGTGANIRRLAISPDGRTLALGGTDGCIRLWDLAANQPLVSVQAHQGPVQSIAFATEGNIMASTGSLELEVRLWDAATGLPRGTLQGHKQGVTGLVFSPYGNLLATVGLDRTVRLWNWLERRATVVLPGHRSAVWSVAFSPNGLTFATGGSDQAVRLWDVGRALTSPPAEVP